jgi:ubiquinone/menaquinone biosynthesis C-methylase UbiE
MASTYDDLREGTPQWVSEQTIVEEFLSGFPPGTAVLDVPVGTGRFLGAYAATGFTAVGVDVSASMLEKARAKLDSTAKVTLEEGSITALPFSDAAFDLVVCIRFMDWVAGEAFDTAMSELARVAKSSLIVSIPNYVPIEAIRLYTLRGLLCLLKQWKLRFFMARTRSDHVIHEAKKVRQLFEHLRLDIAKCVCIDPPSAGPQRSGYDRNIYLLHKRD